MAKDGIIGNRIPPAITGASGVYSLRDQFSYKKNNSWPLTTWGLYRQINITSTPVNNFQVRILLTTSNFDYSKCRADGGDIRFVSQSTDNPGTSYLPYWIETWNTSGNSVIWVKIPNASTTSLYMRYRSPFSTSLSSIDNTMETGMRFRYFTAGGTSPTIPNANVVGGGTTSAPNNDWTTGTGVISVGGVGTASDGVGVVWDGWVTPTTTGNYTFFGTSDDGQRLYINNSLVINTWVDRGPTENSYAYSNWNDGTPKAIRYDFYENGGGATAKLGWTPPSGTKAYPIPSTNLRSPKYSATYSDPYSYVATVGSEIDG